MKFILLSITGLLLLGCSQKLEKADYRLSSHYPSEECIRINDSIIFQDYEYSLIDISYTEVINDTLMIYSYNGQFIFDEPFGRLPTLDYFLNRFPEPPTIVEKNKDTYIVKYKNSVIEVVSEEIFREYSMILAKNAVIVDTCNILVSKLEIGMSKQQCMTSLNFNDEYQDMMDSLKVLYFKCKYQWHRFTFNDEEMLEKIELYYDL